MTKALLVTRPDHDLVTKYLAAWSEEIVALARRKGLPAFDLGGTKANRRMLESYVRTHEPSFLFLNGHGDAHTITGYDNEPLLDAQSRCPRAIIYARSCKAARALGPMLVAQGLGAFIGYRRNFIFGYAPDAITRPKHDAIARLFLGPSNLVASTLIKSHPAREAYRRSKEAMYCNFRRMVSSAASDEERYAARWLWGNLNSQVLLGDQGARV